jgi:hypothetical protein
MVKRAFSFLLFSVVFIFPISADIGENFKAGGMALEGNIGINYFKYDMLSPTLSSSDFLISLAPKINFLLIDYVAFGLSPSFSYRFSYSNTDTYSNNFTIGLDAGFSFFLVPDPSEGSGLAHCLGIDTGIDCNLPHFGKNSFGDYAYKDFSLYFSLDPSYKVLLFISERTALSVRFHAEFRFLMIRYDNNGNPVNEDLNLNLSTGLTFGVSYFIPTEDKWIIK